MNAKLTCDKSLTYWSVSVSTWLLWLIQNEVRSILIVFGLPTPGWILPIVKSWWSFSPTHPSEVVDTQGTHPWRRNLDCLEPQTHLHRTWEGSTFAQPWVSGSWVFFQAAILTNITNKATLVYLLWPDQTCRTQKFSQTVSSRLKSYIHKSKTFFPWSRLFEARIPPRPSSKIELEPWGPIFHDFGFYLHICFLIIISLE